MGFPADSLEKVWMLVRLLNLMVTHPILGPRIALKGRTAVAWAAEMLVGAGGWSFGEAQAGREAVRQSD